MSTKEVFVLLENEQKFEKATEEQMKNSFLEAITNVLGTGGAQSILFNLGLAQFIAHPREFHDNLCRIFGSAVRAELMEKIIVKELYTRINVPYYEGSEFVLEKHIEFVKRMLISKLKDGR